MQTANAHPSEPEITPIIAGHGVDHFEIGELLYQADFEQLEDWELQVQENDDMANQPRHSTKDGILDIYVPARGCTAWLKQKFKGPIVIVYRVRCPIDTLDDEGIQARDINNFWHASDPTRETGIFDSHYNGNFGNYHEMLSYYASSGGGGKIGNRTTRFRRYPRHINGQDVPHLALDHQDGNPDYLITPGQWHTVQLVAFNGLVQYLFDGEIVYEIQEGDTVSVQNSQPGQPANVETEYTLVTFPAYTEGHFGFRLVATHHQYKDLKIFRLQSATSH